MIRVPISPLERMEAECRGKRMPRLRGSIMDGQRNVMSKAGEWAVFKLWPSLRPDDRRGWDALHPDGRRVEIKSKRTDWPYTYLHYSANLCVRSGHQTPDVYVFTRVPDSMEYVNIIGWLASERVPDVGVWHAKGDTWYDKDKANSLVKEDCWLIPYWAVQHVGPPPPIHRGEHTLCYERWMARAERNKRSQWKGAGPPKETGPFEPSA